MNSPLTDYLTAIASDIPPALIDSESLTNIQQLVKELPAELTSLFGFECRLGKNQDAVDFLLCTRHCQVGSQILTGTHPKTKLPERFFTNPVWQKVRNFSSLWTQPNSLLSQKVDNVCLEFDIDKENPDIPVPSFFIGVKNLRQEISQPDNYYQWVEQSLLDLMLDDQLPTDVKSKVRECFTKVPNEGRIFHIGLMLARTTNSVRLCLSGLSGTEILEYLYSIGWEDISGNFSQVLLNISDLVDRLALDIDVSTTVNSKIGVECYFDSLTLTDNNPKLNKFLEYLIKNDLCTPAKSDALLQWRGYNTRNTQEFWPEHLLAAAELLQGNFISTIIRDINHIKLVYSPNSPLQAKGYILVEHYWSHKKQQKQAAVTG
ncbi:hypothetical protein H6G97_28005 [Nostoc flagelliforme FACHB-838]|uniref:Uncharacterized protein n=1 Tax=Nostoc flagelliforme FACHB-838 TaxID=2692904 RepID=A0ABR8DUR5_9NOSO|nr:hypothetical protein [Nostoc flagelliforme]MBD2533207.1 hypothetical protein [Nostoc flagelliforme FACHB-838]